MPDVYFTERGHDRLEDLDGDVQDRIKDKLRDARDRPDHYLKSLTNRDDHSLRIGDYRALIEWDKQDGVRELADDRSTAVYVGDDTTDEGAFTERIASTRTPWPRGW